MRWTWGKSLKDSPNSPTPASFGKQEPSVCVCVCGLYLSALDPFHSSHGETKASVDKGQLNESDKPPTLVDLDG